MVHGTVFCLLFGQYFNHINVYLETGVITGIAQPGFQPYMYWVPTNQPWFVSLIQLSYRQVVIFRPASLAFTVVGWQAEQQSERRRRWRSVGKGDVNVPKSVTRMRRSEGSHWFHSTWKGGTANHMSEEDQSPVYQGSLELLWNTQIKLIYLYCWRKALFMKQWMGKAC